MYDTDNGAKAAANTLGGTAMASTEQPPLMRLFHRLNEVTGRMGDAVSAIDRTCNRMTGEQPEADRPSVAPTHQWPYGGQYAELEMAITTLERLADSTERAANRVTRLG